MFHMSSDHFMLWWLPAWTKYSSLLLSTFDRISRAYHKKVMKVGCHMLWPSPEIPMQRYHFQSIFSFSLTVLSFSSALMSLLSPCGAYMSHEGNKPGPSVLCKKPIGSSSDCQQYRSFKHKRGSARILNVQNRLHVHSWAWSICDFLEESVSCQHMSTHQNRLSIIHSTTIVLHSQKPQSSHQQPFGQLRQRHLWQSWMFIHHVQSPYHYCWLL